MVRTVQKSYRKNILREMKSSISRVVSLFGIVALGVMMLTGLMCIAPDMRTAAQKYYVQQNVFDLRVLSTLGLSQSDINAIAAVDGVDAVQAVKYQDVEGTGGAAMNLQTAIVEDSKPDAERLKQLLKKAFENENISCSCFASGDEFLRAGWREGYQVVFLDICMEGTNGIETAQRLRAADPDLLIVFVTSSPEYVWDAFPVHPFDYLLKPYKEEKFEQLAGELRRVLCRQQPELEVRIARQIVRLPLTKIYYATAQNHYVRVVTDDGECRATANFAQVQEQLQTQPEFLVCNRGVIINMSKVLRFEGDCIEMLDGTHLPVRQKDKNSLLAQFTQYQFRGMQREF